MCTPTAVLTLPHAQKVVSTSHNTPRTIRARLSHPRRKGAPADATAAGLAHAVDAPSSQLQPVARSAVSGKTALG